MWLSIIGGGADWRFLSAALASLSDSAVPVFLSSKFFDLISVGRFIYLFICQAVWFKSKRVLTCVACFFVWKLLRGLFQWRRVVSDPGVVPLIPLSHG